MEVKDQSRVMLVDLGYLLFYRYHATMKNLKFQDKEDATEEEVLTFFKQHLDQQLIKLVKKYKLTPKNTFFCKDARQRSIWRMDIYSEYKGTRGVATDLIHKLKDIMYKTIAPYGYVLEIPRLEADDVAYLASQAILNVKPTIEVFILANDRDYLQVPNIHLIDASFKTIQGTGNHEQDLWIKILMGDKSDNIPPICKGVGKKTAEKLASDEKERNAFVIKKGCQAELARNEQLIRMDRIPDEYVQMFHNTYRFQ